MATNLTSNPPSTTYNQLLHVDSGLDSSLKTVYGGTGTASALKLSSTAMSLDNIKLDGNTISTIDTNGNLTLAPDGSGNVGIANVSITGGSITGITDLAVADGGTGASTASGARTNLGLGTIATQDANNVTLSGGTIATLTSISAASVKSTNAFGFATGAGGTVTQATSKSTGVTLDKTTGTITMNNASLNGSTSVSFTLTNSTIAATDVVAVSIKSGATAASYLVQVDAVAAGSCLITLRNYSGGALGEAVVLSFVVISGVAA